MRNAPAGSALFEKNDAIRFRIEEASIIRDQARARTAMQKDDWLSVGIAALLVIELMNRRDSDVAAVVWFYGRIKSFYCFHDWTGLSG